MLLSAPAPPIASARASTGPSAPALRVVQGLVAAYLIISCTAPYLFGRYLAGLLFVGLAVAVLVGLRIPVAAFGWSVALGSLGAFGVLHGVLSGNQGATSTISLWIVEPVLLGLLLPMVYRNRGDVRRLLTALDIALIATAALGFLLYLNTLAGLGLPLNRIIDPRFTAVDLSEGVLRTNFQGYNSMVFLGPYALFRAFTSQGPFALPVVQRALVGLAAVSGVILSGRQILYLSMPLSLVVVLVLTRRLHAVDRPAGPSRMGRWVLTVAGVGAMMSYLLHSIGLSIQSTLSRTLAQVTYHDASGVRDEESRRLLDRWLENPLFGHGAGTTVKGYARDPAVPWNFELSYHVVLVTFGVLGMALVLAWTVWVTHRLITATRQGAPEIRGVLAGYVGALFAAGTNPYLFKLDGIWMAFVPFAVAVAYGRRAQAET